MPTLIFDTETTGLIENSLLPLNKQPEIIEFYGTLLDDGFKQIDELEFLCRPKGKVTQAITNITGLTEEKLAGEQPWEHYHNRVADLIAKATEVVAHNLFYDFSMVGFEERRLEGTPHKDIIWPLVRICMVENTEWFKGHRLTLSGLHEHLFGTGFSGAHRAKDDVQALTRCFIELRKRGDI